MPPTLFRASGISISPQLLGQRAIQADGATGELLLADPVAGQLRLAELNGLKRLPGAVTAGPGGDYGSISEAVAAAVAVSDPGGGIPASVVLMPGRVAESVYIPKDAWVQLTAVGRARIQASTQAALLVEGGKQVTRLELRGVELECLGPSPALALVGGTGGVRLEAQDCRFESRDRRQSAVVSEGPAVLELLRCDLRVQTGPTALYVTGEVDVRAESCRFAGGATVQTTGRCTLDSSWLSGFSYVQSRLARFWESRVEGDGLLLGGPADLVGCDIQHLELEDGAQVDASLTRLRHVAATSKAWLNTDRAAGEAAFGGTDTLVVEFKVPRIDEAYEVALMLRDRPAGDEVPWLSRKAREGFEIQFLSPQAVRVGWMVSSL